ncbi:MAG: sugar ABC transporter substrate-binding protein [Pirellulales bacterium]|nr:sugar ABC transporter substrate-binding protein [Pirellulales bacterium]
MPKTARGLVAVTLLALLIPATARGEETKNKEKPLRFVFISTCKDEEFFRPVKKGMEDAARLMGVKCEFTGTEGVDIKAQAEMVRKAVADGVDGIALNVIDPKAFDKVVQEAIDRGVPVVAFNVDDNRTPNARLSGVVQQFDAAGRTLGRRAARFVPKGSRVLMTMHDAGISALEERLHGIQEELKKKDVTWKVVITGADPKKAAEVIGKALRDDPKIRTVLCTGQADTEGAGLVLERDYAGKGYTTAGFDLSPNILRLFKAGHIRFTIDQQPYAQGFYPVVQLALYRRYGIMPSDIDAGAGVIDKNNVDSVLELNRQHYR